MFLLSLIFAFCSGFCCCTIFISIAKEDKPLKDMGIILSILFMVMALGCYKIF